MSGFQGPLILVLKPFKSFGFLHRKSPVLDKYHTPYSLITETVSHKDGRLRSEGTRDDSDDSTWCLWVGWNLIGVKERVK
jgi:hypothetical protein